MSNIPIIFLHSANSTPTVTSEVRDTAASQSQRRRRCVRILGRRYALTTTEHKYLEVGINVGYGPSHMEIAVGDKRGNELILGMETWKGLVEHQHLIQEYFSKTDKRPVDPIYIGPLTVEFITFNDTKCVRFEATNVRSIMMASTLTTLFNLDKCIDYMYNWLVSCTDHVDDKYEQFYKIARCVDNPNDITVAIQNSEYFDDKELIDCELLALAF
ncbi:uncharacterized protein LOC113561924 [Ooceraea biroi]|uniref:uncharacterized protein LOC113561924 n=1 Tax=Ooceraea biroi TaxID=2015173 RepID=UPI000F07FBF1|nr:uncharacterized protein LOC113561924 [Ooceraea biroi]